MASPPVLAADVPTALLVVGVLVLCVTTAVTSLSLPSLGWHRRSRRATVVSPPLQASYRRVITGRAPTLPPLELLAGPAGQPARRADGPPVREEVRAAEELIARLLETDPEGLARLMTRWINEDGPDDARELA